MVNNVASLTHKKKYYNIYNEHVTIWMDLSKSWKIHKDLQQSQDATLVRKEKESTLEVNDAYFIKNLETMVITHHSGGQTFE